MMGFAATMHVAGRDIRRSVQGRAPADVAMDRYAAGEDAAFGEVYDAVAPRLYAYLLRQARSESIAEDVLQQTLLRMHVARGSFLVGAEVMPWAYAIARRLLIDRSRRHRREVLSDDASTPGDTEPSADDPADDLVQAAQLSRRLDAELAKLPEAQRTAFDLIKREGLSMAEAASILGTSVTAVKLRAHRAYVALRAALGDVVEDS
jgi:RNA polymerase sigma-70 factor (ECF subfamily)